MVKKCDIFIDLVLGIIGAYRGYVDDPSGESDLVQIKYVPFNGLRTKSYPISVPKSSIIHVELPTSGIPGTYPQMVFVVEDSKGNAAVADQLKNIFNQRFAEMREKIENQRLEIMTSKHRASEKSQESRKQIQEDSQLTRRRESHPFDVFGENRFGGSESRFGRDFED